MTVALLFVHRCYKVRPAEIGYLRFVLEGYDGLVWMRTLDSRQALVEISFSPSCESAATALLVALGEELGIGPAEFPAGHETV